MRLIYWDTFLKIRVEIHVDGKVAFLDKTRLTDDISKTLKRPAVLNGSSATAVLIFKSKTAKSFFEFFKRAVRTLNQG